MLPKSSNFEANYFGWTARIKFSLPDGVKKEPRTSRLYQVARREKGKAKQEQEGEI